MRSIQHLRNQKGFTIVELLIVIVIIGILATLVIVTFRGIQQRARNTQRTTDINAVNSHVEAFYANNGYYPTRTNFNLVAWRATNAQGLDPAALADPRAPATQTMVATPTTDRYAYEPETAAGASCEADETTCAQFTLTAVMEGGDPNYVKTSN